MQAADSFTYPFRRGAGRAWAAGVPLLLLWPLTFPLVLGYAVRATRAAATDPLGPPPRLGIDRRLVSDGLLLAAWSAVALAPLVLMAWLLGSFVSARVPAAAASRLTAVELYLAATAAVALPWGIAVLAAAPPSIAAFAVTGSPRRLFDVAAALGVVRARFAECNLAGVAIVTAWIVALAGAGLVCVGFLPGAFYAILVSAHATASLAEATPGTKAPPAG